MNLITRNEAVKLAGEENVLKAENAQAEFEHVNEIDGTVKSSGSSTLYDEDGFCVSVKVWYEHGKDEYFAADQLDELNWDIAGYTVE